MVAQNLETRVGETVKGYLRSDFLNKALEENGWDYNARKALGAQREGDPAFYSEAGPDAVKYAADLEKAKAHQKLVNDISYNDLIALYDNENLKGFLETLPTLKKGNEELKKAHEAFYEARQAYTKGIKLMNKDPQEFRQLAMASAGDEADAYYAGGRTESSSRVYAGRMLEAQRQLYATIDKIKPASKKK